KYTFGFGGTSGATPFVCGSTALIKQLNPDWTPEDVKTALMNNAFIMINPNNNLPFTWTDQGSGRVDVYATATTPLLIKPYSIFIMEKEGKIDIKVKNLLDNDLEIKVTSSLISQVTGITFDFLDKEEVFTVKANDELVIPFNYIVDDKTPEGYYDAVVYFRTNDRTLHIPIVIKKGIPKVPTKILDDISIEPRKISPNGDGVEDTIKFHFKLNFGEKGLFNEQAYRSRIGGVIIDVLDEKGTTKLGTIYKKVLMNGVYDFIWDGRDFEGKFFLCDGRYQYKIYCITIESGDQLQLVEEGVQTGFFTVDENIFLCTKIETRDSVAKNTEFFFDVGVKAAPDLKIVNSELTFDPEYLEVVDVLPGDFLKEGGSDVNVEYSVDKEYGKIKVKVTRANEKGVTGEGTVFRIKFKAIKDGGTRVAVSSFVGFDSQNRPLDFLLIEKVIKITLLMGDINDDGKVNSEDLIIFAKAFGTKIGDTYYNEKCDLNGDGKVDADDLLLLAKNFGTSAP
ncbi:MAG TPA: S8 family serine peptidase, partial [Caldisericia bacterium]|nr:S8 family serine peptidase [Caldisericia bacterium]